MTNIKQTWNEVNNHFKSEGYVLLTTIYINSHQKLDTICPNGHPYIVQFYCFKNAKNRCTLCSGNRKYTYEEVKRIIEKEGYQLLTNNYINSKTKIELICPNKHVWITRLNSFIFSNHRCSECYGTKKHSLEEIQKFFYDRGESLLSDSYRNNKQKLQIKCANEHTYKISYNGACKGVSCPTCYIGPINKKKTLNEINEALGREGYKLANEEYKNANTKITLICPKNHEWFVKLSDFTNKNCRCPYCSLNGSSKEELELLEWVKQYYPLAAKHRVYYNPKNKTKYVEFDILIPELSLGIEYSGLIWHSERFKKDKKYHFNKMMYGFKNGIRLITIFQDEWLHRKDQVKNFLLSTMNQNTIKIGARKTTSKTVSKKEAAKFLNDNHIQGSTNTDVCFGLFYEKELVGLISGSKHHRQGQHGIFVLNRLVFKSNFSIVGGSSKLLNNLIEYAKVNGFKKLISWSDNRYSIGGVYEKMGFTLEEEMNPDYSYVARNKRISKQSCQKKYLLRKGGIGNTEKEMANSLGLYRIYDCGKKRWIMNL